MSGLKRKRSKSSDAYRGQDFSDDEVNISNVLSGHMASQDTPSDDNLSDFLQGAIAKRDMKNGSHGRVKISGKRSKGEVNKGSFQSMGLHLSLLRSLNLQGYRSPTPIQRLAIPALLANPPNDLVAMARTGSGKTLAYMIPLVQRLSGRHSVAFGARSLILIPTRELALQILTVGKELSRGWHSDAGKHAGDNKEEESSNNQNLRWSIIVGGEGLDEQFEDVTNNPDVIIATPGRLLHLIVEMDLDLKAIQYVVFDEADRLFEMGFETALTEIISRLPPIRQTLLFSATLPKSLVEFAKAGLQQPKLLRLDAENSISSDLKMAFFTVRQIEKEACLLALLRDVIKVPLGKKSTIEGDEPPKKGYKAKFDNFTAPHQTLVFVATKHHVEFVTSLLTAVGYSVSHIYGSLDQSARMYQMDQFRRGATSILVVTDIAARGLDIPILAHVVNFDFPHGSKVFVHRVGRTARAGRQGWAWSFVTNEELPYLLDLQLFLGRPLKKEVDEDGDEIYIKSLILGAFDRTKIDDDIEYIRALEHVHHSLPMLRNVMKRGHLAYLKSKGKASPASYERAKDILKEWSLAGSYSSIHPILSRGHDQGLRTNQEDAKRALLRSIASFKPSETVFEIGSKGNTAIAALMKSRRKALGKSAERVLASTSLATLNTIDKSIISGQELANEDDIATAFTEENEYRDTEFYLSHLRSKENAARNDEADFTQQAQEVAFDLTGDDVIAERQTHRSTWDKKKKKFVKGEAGANNVKLVTTESGTKLPATYRNGRFEEWKARTKLTLPKVGEAEHGAMQRYSRGPHGRRFRHNAVIPAKPLDKSHINYGRKVSKKADNVGDNDTSDRPRKKLPATQLTGRSLNKVKSELRTVEQVRKSRRVMERKRAKNARQSHSGGKKARR